MAYIHTPASMTASMGRGLGARQLVGRRLVVPHGELAPGVDGLGGDPITAAATAASSAQTASSTVANIAQIVGAVTTVGATAAGIYFGRKDAKDARAAADRQEQMAKAEAKRAAQMQKEQVRAEAAALANQTFIDRIPGGWATVSVVGAVIGLGALYVLRRKKS